MLNNTWTLSEKLRPLIAQIDFVQNGKIVFRTTTFAGYVSCYCYVKYDENDISLQ